MSKGLPDKRVQKFPAGWKRILGRARVQRLAVILVILWGVIGLLAHSESTRDRLKNFTERSAPAVAAIDPWFVVSRVLNYSAGCEGFYPIRCPGDGIFGMLWRLPGALWHAAKDVGAAGWPATGTALIALLLGAAGVLDLFQSRDTQWWNPFVWVWGTISLLLIAGIFTWLLKMVFWGLLNAFGSLVALTGIYSSWILALDVAYNAVMSWFHVSRRAGVVDRAAE